MLPRIVPLEDEEVSAELAKAFTKRGIKLLTGTRVQAIETTETGVRVTVSGEGGEQVLEAEQALVAIGFKPNSGGLGLEELGVKLNQRGFIEIDERMATNVPGIWAIGDVTGQAAAGACGFGPGHHLRREYRRGGDDHAGLRDDAARDLLPAAGGFLWLHRSAGAASKAMRSRWGASPSRPTARPSGWAITPAGSRSSPTRSYGEILGAHLIGPEVSELLPELTLAQQDGADRRGDRPQRARPPDPERGADGSGPRRSRAPDTNLGRARVESSGNWANRQLGAGNWATRNTTNEKRAWRFY